MCCLLVCMDSFTIHVYSQIWAIRLLLIFVRQKSILKDVNLISKKSVTYQLGGGHNSRKVAKPYFYFVLFPDLVLPFQKVFSWFQRSLKFALFNFSETGVGN